MTEFVLVDDSVRLLFGERFKRWQSLRVWDMDIMYDETNAQIQRGFSYPDGAWIVLLPQYGGVWHSHAETSECESGDLEIVEQWLWRNFSDTNYDEEVDGVS